MLCKGTGKNPFSTKKENTFMSEKPQKTITFPPDAFLSEARKEYSGYLFRRLFQELLQNSIDAGASNIDILWDENTRELVFIDNGKGVDENTLENGLLTFESSIKAEGNIGGYGAAKKLILFSHPKWSVKTGTGLDKPGIHAFGGSIHYNTEGCEPIKGSEFRLTLSDSPYWDFSYIKEKLEYILSNSYGDAIVSFNGETIEFGEKGPIYLSKGTADIRQNKNTSYRIIIRFGGLYMFEDYSTGNSYFYDVKGSSRDALVQNREGFKSGTQFYNDYYLFRSELTNNSSTGVYAAASFQKQADKPDLYKEGIQYSGDDIPKNIAESIRVSKREKMIYSLCFWVAANFCELYLSKDKFGFYFDPGLRGLWANGKIWMNPNFFASTENDDWIYDCIVVFIHEYVHYMGHGHDESFILAENRLYTKFLKAHTGLAPIKAGMRAMEKALF
jgi:hypothetical protein